MSKYWWLVLFLILRLFFVRILEVSLWCTWSQISSPVTLGLNMSLTSIGQQKLVGGLEHQFYFPINIGNLIIPIDEVIFFRGVAQPPTSIHVHQVSTICLSLISDNLVGGLEHFLFSHILGIIIPIDFHIFQRGSNHQPEKVTDECRRQFVGQSISRNLCSVFVGATHAVIFSVVPLPSPGLPQHQLADKFKNGWFNKWGRMSISWNSLLRYFLSRRWTSNETPQTAVRWWNRLKPKMSRLMIIGDYTAKIYPIQYSGD